ncbi:MAG: S41 family peptidase [Cyclobacteriaceae bacterium]|nr:S41 family peptidase [Cyclobacteriaceae bacterium]
MRRSKPFLVSFLTLLLVAILLGFSTDNKYFEITRNLDIFTTLFKEVNAYYVDEVDPKSLIRKGIDSMLASLDPYTNFISEDEIDSYRAMTTGQYGGIGISVGNIGDMVYVTMIHENFIAHKSGIRIGDEIIEIDGKSVLNQTTEAIAKSLKGSPKTEVEVIVKRVGESESISFKLNREKIFISNVPYSEMINNNIGYILLSDFTFGAAKEVTKAMNELKAKGAENIILDIRNNSGGLLNEAINVSNVFIPRGKEIVSTKGKAAEWNKSYKSLNMPVDIKIPLVVLINEISASASEIVAGVMQDYDRGVLVGRKTFGKGLVQTTRPLAYNTQLKVTAAKYYTPSGRCIQKINYSDNNRGEHFDEIDSLKLGFKTKNGRLMYDGGGLTPDIEVKGRKIAPVTKELVMKGYVFRYANIYRHNHESITSPKQFKISDEEYNKFKEWIIKQNFEYTSPIGNNLNLLENVAKKEMIYDKIKLEFEALKSDIQQVKQNDFEKFEEEIKLMLQKEIVSRYYLVRGDIEATIHQDNDIKKAVELLSDNTHYHMILGKQ